MSRGECESEGRRPTNQERRNTGITHENTEGRGKGSRREMGLQMGECADGLLCPGVTDMMGEEKRRVAEREREGAMEGRRAEQQNAGRDVE
ncbi:hypothetical protein CgunFtcFv8_021915 [Champsocephalus gunnari]|uniref:Uncharacterized protein n=1 Tax=Champsocephalus gunnari TaxID=52237 RepID=A0AAN8HST2_CHAGU|nr:hypothetical protein CgunFtcFv8_021915 [Champsocephalus gunnari]